MAKHNDPIVFPLRLSHEVERLFQEMIHRPWGCTRELRGWDPSVDLFETPESFILEADLPGVKEEDVAVEVNNGDLVLRGRRSLEKSESDGYFHTLERCSGEFTRRLKLPQSVNRDAIQATFTQGVLKVILPKAHKRKERST